MIHDDLIADKDLKISMIKALLDELFRNIRIRCTQLTRAECREKSLAALDQAKKEADDMLCGTDKRRSDFSDIRDHLGQLIISIDKWSIGSYRGRIEDLQNFCSIAEKEGQITPLMEKYGAICSRIYKP